jgi:hypothetical protein
MQLMMRKIWITIWLLTPSTAWAQTIAPQMPAAMIIEPADADAFREIVESTIPPKYNSALIRWYTAILQRQQAKQAEAAKAAKDESNKPQ